MTSSESPVGAPMLPTANHSVNDVAGLVLMGVCAVSAGIHAGLVPEHLHEGGPLLGGAFALSALGLALATLVVRQRAADPRVVGLAVVVLAANVAAYTLSRTTGLPVLMPNPEEVDLFGVVTTVAEALGVAAGVAAITRKELP